MKAAHLSIFFLILLVTWVLHLRSTGLMGATDHLVPLLVDLVVLGLELQVQEVHLSVIISLCLEGMETLLNELCISQFSHTPIQCSAGYLDRVQLDVLECLHPAPHHRR